MSSPSAPGPAPTPAEDPVPGPDTLPAPDIRLVAIDLDGTLLDSAKRPDPDFPALLGQLLERGIAVVPASGRQHESIRRIVSVPHLEERHGPLAIIAENGALASRAGEVVAVDGVARPAVVATLAAVREYTDAGGDVGVVLCGRRSAYVTRTDDAFLAVTAPYYPLLEVLSDPEELAAIEDDVLKVAVWEPGGTEYGVAGPITAALSADTRVLVSAPTWVDVMSPTADKGTALAALQAELGVAPEHTMAFGDFPNDIGMLHRAAWSFAMAGAHPAARAAARFQAPSNDEQGVTRTIRAMLGLDE